MRWLSLPILCVSLAACSGGAPSTTSPPSGSSNPTYDVDALGIPRFAASNYLDLSFIAKISKFRSGVGHDYRDNFEACRSMKHYFQPRLTADWSTIPIYAPVTGTIALTRPDVYGTQLVIRATAQPAFTFIIFHVNPTVPVNPGATVTGGQQLGWHIGPQTFSDIAVSVDTPAGYKLISWFDVMTDGLFAAYAARGIPSRTTAVISRAARDADLLTCTSDAFNGSGSTENWTVLN